MSAADPPTSAASPVEVPSCTPRSTPQGFNMHPASSASPASSPLTLQRDFCTPRTDRTIHFGSARSPLDSLPGKGRPASVSGRQDPAISPQPSPGLCRFFAGGDPSARTPASAPGTSYPSKRQQWDGQRFSSAVPAQTVGTASALLHKMISVAEPKTTSAGESTRSPGHFWRSSLGPTATNCSGSAATGSPSPSQCSPSPRQHGRSDAKSIEWSDQLVDWMLAEKASLREELARTQVAHEDLKAGITRATAPARPEAEAETSRLKASCIHMEQRLSGLALKWAQ